MANRVGKLCDDCLVKGVEELIGTRASPIMYMVVGTYENGEIQPDATLPRFGWQIYCAYSERHDVLEMVATPRAELCGPCWVKRLSEPGALELLTHDAYYVEAKAQWEAANPSEASVK